LRSIDLLLELGRCAAVKALLWCPGPSMHFLALQVQLVVFVSACSVQQFGQFLVAAVILGWLKMPDMKLQDMKIQDMNLQYTTNILWKYIALQCNVHFF